MERRTTSARSDQEGLGGNGHLGEEVDETRDDLTHLLGRAADLIRERPGTSLLVAVAVGFLLGRLLRA